MENSALAAAGAQLASTALAHRDPASEARRRIETVPARRKRKRVEPLGPTQERLAKGDVLRVGGVYRSVSPVKRLFDQGKLDSDPMIAQALLRTAERLHAHYMGCEAALRGQDLSRERIDEIDVGALMGEERRAQHYAKFREACQVMGWYEAVPHQGNGRIVVAVACQERSVRDAATAQLPAANMNAMQVAAMDRLRQGLFTLAIHWRMISG